jgi:SAM-dependent methyltransferase
MKHASCAGGFTGIAIGGGDTDKPLSLRKRLRLITRYVPLDGRSVLDCGCGAGAYVLAFLAMGADAQGIEYCAEKVVQFRRLGHDPARVQQGNLEQITFPDASFDFALLNEVLEHVPDDARAVSEVYRVLKPGGTLVVFSPNRLFPFETHGVTLARSRRVLPPYLPFVPYVPLGLGRRLFRFHARNYFPWELRGLLTRARFRIVHRTWLWQTFENISGHQPALIRWSRPVLRLAANTLERLPGVCCLGVSQVLVVRKP